MESRKLTNILLLIVIAFLMLIVVRMYDVVLVPEVQAQWSGKSLVSSDLIPVAIHARNANGSWYPCQINNNDKLMIEVVE